MGRWTDIFRFGTQKPTLKPDPRIRWFGKLPTYADYYSSKTDEDWAVEFNDWILKGYEVFLDRQREANRKSKKVLLPISGGALRLPKSGMTVFASIQDYGGDMRGRPFPICFYAGIPSEQWTGPSSGRLGPASRIVRELIRLRREVMRFFKTPGRFESAFGNREVDLTGINADAHDVSWKQEARSVPLTDWFMGAKASLETDDMRAWFHLVEQWGNNVAKLESKTFEPTFSFPLSAGCSMEAQLAGWVRWLESRMDLDRRLLSLVVTGELEEGTARLSVVARELVQEDFLLVTPLRRTLPYLDDLAAVEAKTGDETEPDGNKSSDPAGDGNEVAASWGDFVERACEVT